VSDNRVKAFSLARAGRLGQVTAQVTGLRHFSYPGAIGLGRLSLGKAKTLSQACFRLIPQLGLG
jgi:hypothetical protein